jgi:hypothetical protein
MSRWQLQRKYTKCYPLVGVHDVAPWPVASLSATQRYAGVYEAAVTKRVPAPTDPTGFRNVLSDIKLVSSGVQIQAKLGVHFGIRYIIVGKGDVAPIRTVWKFPSPGIKNPNTGEIILRYEGTTSKRIGPTLYDEYYLENPWEVVPGPLDSGILDRRSETRIANIHPGELTIKARCDAANDLDCGADQNGSIPLAARPRKTSDAWLR